MVSPIREDSDPIRLKFGGGINSRASEEDIDERECTDGQNFALDPGNFQFRPRKPFDKIGTTLNSSAEIRGGGSLLKSDGTVAAFIQAGDQVYELDANDNFSQIASVSSGAKLRGRLEHQWQLSNKVIITDLSLTDPVKEWDGSTFQNVTFTDECDNSFGTFKARYCYVENERAVFANIDDNSSPFPHLIVGSKRGDYTNITVSNRPSGAISEEDPFFIVQPDNFYINGINELFGQIIVSSRRGSMFKLTGSNAQDFAMSILAVRNSADGDEPMTVTSTDIVYGREGAIESVRATDRFGDVEANDLSSVIKDDIAGYDDWTLVHNKRLNRTYCYSDSTSEFWVMYHDLKQFNINLSPWSKWATAHSLQMNPTFMMNMLSPHDGKEYVFMGDSSGNVYRLEGTTGGGDGGDTDINTNRTSGLFSAIAEGKASDIQGYVRYKRKASTTTDLVMKWGFKGEHIMDNSVTVTVPNDDDDEISRQRFIVPGAGTDFQITTTVDSSNDFTINEIGFRFSEGT